MAGNLSNNAEAAILLTSVGKAATNAAGTSMTWPPTTVYCALYNGASWNDTTPATELTSTGGYARVAVTTSTTASVFGSYDSTTGSIRNNGSYNAATSLTGSGSGIITFPTATANWSAAVTHVALVDASTGGNVIWYGALTNSKTVNSGDTVSFAAGDLVLSLD